MQTVVNWDQSVEEIGPGLFRYFRTSCESADASDLVQESLIRLVRKTETGEWNPERGSLRMYAFGIARLVKMEFRRERGAFTLRHDPDFDPTNVPYSAEHEPENAFLMQERLRVLHEAIRMLAPDQREVLELQIDEELKLEEIAEILAMPLNTVKSHARRARERLAEMLSQRGITS